MIHRSSHANKAGDLVATLDDGLTPTTMTTVEQTALCRLSRRIADFAIRGHLDYAYLADIGRQLSMMRVVEKRSWPARNRAARVEFVDRVPLAKSYLLDPAFIERRVLASLPATTCIDVAIEVDPSASVFLVGPLELAGGEEVELSGLSYPSWLTAEVRPNQPKPRGL